MQLIYDGHCPNVTIIYNLGTVLARGRGGQQVKKYIQFKIFPTGGGEVPKSKYFTIQNIEKVVIGDLQPNLLQMWLYIIEIVPM